MRLILFFDLPVETSKQRRDYRHFVKDLKRNGFYMLQESVYIKLSIDSKAAQASVTKIKRIIPSEGRISVLTITEQQFLKIDNLLGENITSVINSDERIIEI